MKYIHHGTASNSTVLKPKKKKACNSTVMSTEQKEKAKIKYLINYRIVQLKKNKIK